MGEHTQNSSRCVKTIPVFLITFFLSKVKIGLNGKGFQDAEDIENNAMAELNAVPMEPFADCFKKTL
jgi:hypothetical protein